MGYMKDILSWVKRGHGFLYASFVPLNPKGKAPLLDQVYSTENGGLASFFSTVFEVALSVGAIAAVLRLAYAGYVYMVSDMWTNKEHAKEIIRDTFLGLLLLISIYIILYQINPDILKLDFLSGLQKK